MFSFFEEYFMKIEKELKETCDAALLHELSVLESKIIENCGGEAMCFSAASTNVAVVVRTLDMKLLTRYKKLSDQLGVHQKAGLDNVTFYHIPLPLDHPDCEPKRIIFND